MRALGRFLTAAQISPERVRLREAAAALVREFAQASLTALLASSVGLWLAALAAWLYLLRG